MQNPGNVVAVCGSMQETGQAVTALCWGLFGAFPQPQYNPGRRQNETRTFQLLQTMSFLADAAGQTEHDAHAHRGTWKRSDCYQGRRRQNDASKHVPEDIIDQGLKRGRAIG